MDEIKTAIWDIVASDATMQGLTGYTASDPRIYEWFPANTPTLSSTLPGYITYRMTSYGRGDVFIDHAEHGDIFIHFDVWAYNSDTKGSIALRLVNLFDLRGSFSTTNYRILQTLIAENFEMPVEGESSTDRRYRHHITVQLRGVLKKTFIGNLV